MGKKKANKEKKTPKSKIAIGISQSDINIYVEKFRSEVARKKEAYQLYCQKFNKKEKQ